MRTIQVHIEENLKNLLAREDTDGDRRITIQDHGPHSFQVRATDGNNYLVEGTYYLSNLLQELALLREGGQAVGELDPRHIFEKPVSRFSRMIREHYWDGLTRRLDAAGLEKLMTDSKSGSNAAPRVYVPYSDPTAQAYFRKLAASGAVPGLKVIVLPEKITPEYVRSINLEPGILSLQLRQNGEGHWEGTPFVVPGGRFNEMYGWDSYFEALGLIADKRVDLAKAMVDNFCYEITHYGQILNASRSYYLTRSQPPFLTDMALRVYHELPKKESSREWLAGVLRTAIREYHSVWMNPERLTETGLSRYYAYGIGITPETEEGHYDAVLRPFAQKAGMDVRGYAAKMLKGEIREPALDEYFLHDRAVRESGHDTSYRIEGRCAHLNTVDLNALLYRYETDLAEAIARNFDDALPLANGQVTRSAEWQARAKKRRELVDRYLWDGERGLYFDYHFIGKKRIPFVSATLFYPLWARMASPAQAEAVVRNALPLLEEAGGLAATTEESRGPVGEDRPPRQWDYPNGWAPHQMMAWEGLSNYGYHDEARRLAYRWLDMITRNAVHFNGTIPEKYDVVRRSHQVFMEYGNVGTDFAYLTKEGFGWMNASYQVGLKMLGQKHIDLLNTLTAPEWG